MRRSALFAALFAALGLASVGTGCGTDIDVYGSNHRAVRAPKVVKKVIVRPVAMNAAPRVTVINRTLVQKQVAAPKVVVVKQHVAKPGVIRATSEKAKAIKKAALRAERRAERAERRAERLGT